MSVVVSLQGRGPCRKQLKVEVPAPPSRRRRSAWCASTARTRPHARLPQGQGARRSWCAGGSPRRSSSEVMERLGCRATGGRRRPRAPSSPLLPPEVDEVKDAAARRAADLRRHRRDPAADRAAQHQGLRPPRTRRPSPGRWRSRTRSRTCASRSPSWVPVDRPAARGDLRRGRDHATLGAAGEAPARASAHRQGARSRSATPTSGRSSPSPSPGMSAGQETTFTRRHEHPPAEEGGAPERPRADVPGARSTPSRSATCRRSTTPSPPEGQRRVRRPRRAARGGRRRGCASNKVEQRSEARHRALLDQLRERHPLELPQGVVRKEVEGLVQDYAEILARRGVDIEQGRRSTGTELGRAR